MISKMIPALWVRCAVLVGFIGFMVYQEMMLIAVIASGLLLLTLAQLFQAYRQR
ncbi:MAG: hypothetical protein Q4A92_09705 [Corynebacterium sp.]|nr:hypothetical protein [Corynebacterium sp.]